ncbi:MAG: BamA/TamA family outer membrane protein [Bryobacterales bacterium]|nr:BamA/TamA family outer membrane protein [Bryobacterales bacterium]
MREDILSVRVGQPLQRSALRNSIQALFRTGRYSNIQVDAVAGADGLDLTFLTEPAWFIGNVRVDGVTRPPSKGQLINATKLDLGTIYTEEKLGSAISSLRALLGEYGFREAAITPSLLHDAESQQVHIDLQVESGRRARIGGLLAAGETAPLNEEGIRSITGWARNSVFRRDRIQRGIGRLREHFQAQGYWQSEIGVQAAEYRAASNQVTLVVRIRPGPKTSVRIEGAHIRPKQLQRHLALYSRGSIDDDVLRAGGASLAEHFQSRGYFAARVDFEVERSTAEEAAIVYRINRGPRQHLRAMEIAGNRFFDTATLLERLQLRASRSRSGHGSFSPAMLADDLQSLRQLYASNGFRDARVTGEVRAAHGGRPNHLAVTISIDEGPQTLVAALVTTGMSQFPADESQFGFASAPGQPLSEASIATDRQRILQEYFSAGYQDVTFDWHSEAGEPAGTAVLHYNIRHGKPRQTRRTILSGAGNTRSETLAGRIELAAGEPLSQARMFATQRNLYDLGVFSKVEVALQNPSGVEESKNVLIQVEEARRWALGFGGGAEFGRFGRNTAELTNPVGDTGFSPRMTLEATRLNVLGKAHTLSFSTRLSLLQQRGLFTYEAPRWFDSDRWRLTVTGLYDTFRNVNTFTGRRFEGAFQLSQTPGARQTVLYRYAFRRTSVDENTLNIEPLLVPLTSQPVRVGLLSATYISDRRDDPTDTSSGTYNTVDVALASKFWGAQPNFARMFAQNSTYSRIREGLVFARTLQVGINIPWSRFGGQALGEEGFAARPDPRVPLSERYFGGGSSSHRGFAYNQAGPRDSATGFPLGGGAQLLNSLELRFPLAGPDLSGVLFHDAGNVYSRPGRISLRSGQRFRTNDTGGTEFDFDYLVHALGLGIRYRTPIGPLRLDLAYSPNPPRFVGFDGTREQLLLGAGTFREQRASFLQFHFSLGQTF